MNHTNKQKEIVHIIIIIDKVYKTKFKLIIQKTKHKIKII